MQVCDRKRGRLWVRFPHEETTYLIFSFPRFSIEAKRGAEFRQSTCNTNRNQWKLGNGSALRTKECLDTRFPGFCLHCHVRLVQREALYVLSSFCNFTYFYIFITSYLFFSIFSYKAIFLVKNFHLKLF